MVQKVKASDASSGEKDCSMIVSDKRNDQEPMVEVSYTAEYNVFAVETKHFGQPESINNTCVGENVDSNVIPDSSDMCDNKIQTGQNAKDEHDALSNLIANLTLDTKENKKILKQLKKAYASLTQELKECKSNLEESNTTRDCCLIALQCKQIELEKYMDFNDRTGDYDKLEQQMKNDTGCKEKESTVFLKEREQYFEIPYLKAQLQDKNIAISELKKLIEKIKEKGVDTNSKKQSILGKPPLQPIRNKPMSPRESVGSNDIIHSYYLEEAKKKAQLQKDKALNTKPSVQQSARLPNTANVMNGNPSRVNLKQLCGRYKRWCCSLIPAESDSSPHAHAQATKTYIWHQDSKIKKAQYEHVGQDTISQDGKDDKDLKDKDLKISELKSKSKTKGSRSKITQHEGTSLQRDKDLKISELKSKSKRKGSRSKITQHKEQAYNEVKTKNKTQEHKVKAIIRNLRPRYDLNMEAQNLSKTKLRGRLLA
uniref:Uncharacterized protein n=1 Tax=Tanacetum cinerariifolium TaxID=118510 RepID=A0A6L2KG79_TANCI|nr:hypothetical protein [Tanacetum cinerariifolium]